MTSMKNCLSILLVLFTITLNAQRIENSKKELNETQNTIDNNSDIASSTFSYPSTNPVDNYSASKPNQSYYYDSFDEFLVECLLWASYYSLFGSYEDEDHLHNKLTPYPYFDNHCGNYTDNYESGKIFRADIENIFLFEDSKTMGNHFKAKGHFKQYVYGQLDHYFLQEEFNNVKSNLSFYQFSVGYDRLRFKKFNLGFLIGLTHFGSGINRTGLNVGFHGEAFIYKNFSLDSSISWFNVNDVDSRTFDIKGKYHFKKLFTSLGIEKINISNSKFNFVSFGAGIYF